MVHLAPLYFNLTSPDICLCILTWHRQTFVLREKKYSIERPKVEVTNFASFSEIVQKFVTWQTSLNFHYCQNGQSDRIELYSTEHEKNTTYR